MNFQELAEQVMALCPSTSKADIIKDLKHTKNADITINRIFDGMLHEGIRNATSPVKIDRFPTSGDDDDLLIPKPNTQRPSYIPSQNTNTHVIDLCGVSPVRSTEKLNSYATAEQSFDMDCSIIIDSSPTYTKPTKKIQKSKFVPLSLDDSDLDVPRNDHLPSKNSLSSMDFLFSSDDNATKPAANRPLKKTVAVNKEAPTAIEDESDSDDITGQVRRVKRVKAVESPVRKKAPQKRKASTGASVNSELALKNRENAAKLKQLNAQEKAEAKALKDSQKAEAKLIKEREKAEANALKMQENLEKRIKKKANKLRTQVECMEEIIVIFDKHFLQNNGAHSLAEIQELGGMISQEDLPIPSSITWRRKVTREWNEEKSCWDSCDESIVDEKFILVKIDSNEMLNMLVDGSLEVIVNKVKQIYPEHVFIILFEGLEKVFKLISRHENSKFTNAVRSMDSLEQPANKKQKTSKYDNLPDRLSVEQVLIWLQIECCIHIQHSIDQHETAEWIGNISKEIAMIPENSHRTMKFFDINFGDKIKSGKDFKDTWKSILITFRDVSEDKAESIMKVYPTFASLWEGYKKCSSTAEAKKLLSSVEIIPTYRKKNAGLRKIGPAISQRIYWSLMGEDPNELMNMNIGEINIL